MADPVEPNLDDIASANAKAFAKMREIAGDLKTLVEHEVLIDDEIPKIIEINPPPSRP